MSEQPHPIVLRAVLVLLLALGLGGCSGLSFPDEPGKPLGKRELNAVPEGSALQVIVTYSGMASTHAALRLAHIERGVLFWDPAGIYGLGEDYELDRTEVARTNDLIIEGAPDLGSYWNFALETGDSGMEVLEWALTRERAEDFYQRLLDGARLGERSIDFSTDVTAPFCALAVSDFLKRYGGDLMRVPGLYLFPTSLAEVLRAQNPQRILIFLRAGSPLEFRNGAPRGESQPRKPATTDLHYLTRPRSLPWDAAPGQAPAAATFAGQRLCHPPSCGVRWSRRPSWGRRPGTP